MVGLPVQAAPESGLGVGGGELEVGRGALVRPEGPRTLRVSGARVLAVASATVLGAENSEVLAPASAVAVAVTVLPLATFAAVLKVKEALPEASVATPFWPMSIFPSSVPAGLEKNWMVKVLLAWLLSLPVMVVVKLFLAEVSTGKF
jgi:hypothetical protein